jgi:hypothetical protein
MSKISFKDPETKSQVRLGPLPFNPQGDREAIEYYLRLYAWHKREALLFHVNIPKTQLLGNKNKKIQSSDSAMVQEAGLWSHHRQPQPQLPTLEHDEATEIAPSEPLDIEKVLGKTVKNGKLHYVVKVNGAKMEIEEDSLRCVILIF